MKYDFAGRLSFNQFNTAVGAGGVIKRVYDETLGYDAFSQMTTRSGVHWGNQIWFSETYTNGRINNNPSVHYDAAGNIYQVDGGVDPWTFQNSTFDASGKLVKIYESPAGVETERFFDGAGREAKSTARDLQNPPDVRTNYYIRSTVLGGEIITVANATGRKTKTLVYAAGATLARQTVAYDASWNPIESMEFEQWDASGMSYRQTLPNAIGSYNGAVDSGEADPLGNGVGLDGVDYFEENLPPDRDFPMAQARTAEDSVMYRDGSYVRCFEDGMPTSCARQQWNLASGIAERARSTYGSIYSARDRRYVGFAFFNANQAAARVSVFGLPTGWAPGGMNFTGSGNNAGFNFSGSFGSSAFAAAAAGDLIARNYGGLAGYLYDLASSPFARLGQVNELSSAYQDASESGGGGSGRGGGPAQTQQSTVSPDCLGALKVAKKDINAINRAYAAADLLNRVGKATGMYPKLLAAIGVRETGFQNINQSGGLGKGIFQIDVGQNPNAGNIIGNIEAEATFAAQLLVSRMNHHSSATRGYPSGNYNAYLQFAAAIRDYNARHSVTQNVMNRPGATVADLDRGTALNNYVSNVLNLMNHCFNR
ncbi:hypothetical protein BH20ACI2_BH20ACI2_14230 [soil metagenome]